MGSNSSLDKSLPPEESFDVQVDLTASQAAVKARGRRDRKQTDLLAPESLEMYAREDARTAREMRALEIPATPPRPTDELPESPAPPERHVAVPERSMAPTIVDVPAHKSSRAQPLWPLALLAMGLMAALVAVLAMAVVVLTPLQPPIESAPAVAPASNTPSGEEAAPTPEAPPSGDDPASVEDGEETEETGRPSKLKRPIKRAPPGKKAAPEAAGPRDKKPVPVDPDGVEKKKYQVVD